MTTTSLTTRATIIHNTQTHKIYNNNNKHLCGFLLSLDHFSRPFSSAQGIMEVFHEPSTLFLIFFPFLFLFILFLAIVKYACVCVCVVRLAPFYCKTQRAWPLCLESHFSSSIYGANAKGNNKKTSKRRRRRRPSHGKAKFTEEEK